MKVRDKIEGDHICLEKMTSEDADIIYHWRSGSSGKFMNQPDGYSVEMQKEWMLSRPSNEINYMILEKKSQKKIGMVAIVAISDQDQNAEIGRLLLEPNLLKTSNPFGLEALKICATEILDKWEYQKINGNVLSSNKAMLKLQLFLGMKEEGYLKDQKIIKGQKFGLHLIALFKEDLKLKYIPKINLLLKAFNK